MSSQIKGPTVPAVGSVHAADRARSATPCPGGLRIGGVPGRIGRLPQVPAQSYRCRAPARWSWQRGSAVQAYLDQPNARGPVGSPHVERHPATTPHRVRSSSPWRSRSASWPSVAPPPARPRRPPRLSVSCAPCHRTSARRYVLGATGPQTFDCSGLVFRAYREAGLAKRIGGEDTAHGYYDRFRRLGRLSRVAPRRRGPRGVRQRRSRRHLRRTRQGGERAPEWRQASRAPRPQHPLHGHPSGPPQTGSARGCTPGTQAHRRVRRGQPQADRCRASPGSRFAVAGRHRDGGSRVAVRGSRTRWGTTRIRVRLA